MHALEVMKDLNEKAVVRELKGMTTGELSDCLSIDQFEFQSLVIDLSENLSDANNMRPDEQLDKFTVHLPEGFRDTLQAHCGSRKEGEAILTHLLVVAIKAQEFAWTVQAMQDMGLTDMVKQ